MASVEVAIVKLIDDSYPGYVVCELVDAYGKTHVFEEKVPFVEGTDFRFEDEFPQAGEIQCTVIEVQKDGIVVDTELPNHVESITGATRFFVSLEKVRD